VLPLQPGLDEFRAFQVEIVGARLAVGADIHLHGAHEIRIFDGALEDLDMSGQPEVVVVLVQDNLALGLAQHIVAIELAACGRLRQVEETNARIAALQLGNDRSHLGIDPVAADQDFEVVDPLLLHAAHRVRQCGVVVVRRDKDTDTRHARDGSVPNSIN
jgi:hypothetical protein